MHHVDVHVSDLAATKRLFDAVAPSIGYELRAADEDFVSYWRGKRPSIGFIADGVAGSAAMQLAFAVETDDAVDAAADAARRNGARNIDGPAIHPEYGDDYYAVFFEDAGGNKFEVLRETE